MEGKDRKLPDFYQEFIEDTSRPGKRTKCGMPEFVFGRLQEALIKKVAWTQIDLPKVEGEFDSLGDEDKANARRVYMLALDSENVLDWETDDEDDLLWAITRKTTNRRSTPESDRNSITEEFTVMDKDGWQVWEITYDKDKPPEPKSVVKLTAEGDHTFGVVPLLRLEMPDAIWAMEKMESACRALLRDLNSMLWALRQTCHPELYEFLAAEIGHIKPVGDKQQDPNRGTNQRRGQGYVQLRGGDDRAEYVGPPMAAAEFALKVCESHRDEMHRVQNQTGVNPDVTSGTIRRSAESTADQQCPYPMIIHVYVASWSISVRSQSPDARLSAP